MTCDFFPAFTIVQKVVLISIYFFKCTWSLKTIDERPSKANIRVMVKKIIYVAPMHFLGSVSKGMKLSAICSSMGKKNAGIWFITCITFLLEKLP